MGKSDKLIEKAKALLQTKDFINARPYLTQILKKKPNHAQALRMTGASYAGTGDIQNAINYVQKSIEIEPNNSKSFMLLGTIYFKMKKYDEAIKYLKKVLEKEPKNLIILKLLGISYELARDFDKAIEYIQEALKINPSDGNMSYMLKTAQIKKQQQDKKGKIKKMLQVSKKIKIEMMRDGLKMEQEEFQEIIDKWASEFGFKIEGDYIIINNDTVLEFIEALDNQFAIWEENEITKLKKI